MRMKITRIKIENFRSIEFAEIVLSEFNVFVGQNNHGKTNLFEAIDWFYTGSGDINQIAFRRETQRDVVVEMEFDGVQAGIETVKNEKNREAFRKFADGRDVLKVIRRKSDGAKRALWDEKSGDWSIKNFAGFDKAFNDCLPRLEYVATSTRLADVSKFGKKTPIGLMLAGVLSAVLEASPQYQKFRTSFDEVFGVGDSDIRVTLDDLSNRVRSHLGQQFPDTEKVKFDLHEPVIDDLLKTFETSIDDGIETTAEEKGDGMQRALMLAIIKTYADFRRENDELGKRFVFLIDEAELHLHPTAQRQLKEALISLASAGDQVFLNTHSSVLVVEDHALQRIFQVVKSSGATEIKKVTSTEKPAVVFDLLGGSPSDLLFPRNFLIVEGGSDRTFLGKVIERFYADQPPLHIVFAGGDDQKQKKSMDGINQILVPLHGTPVYRNKLILLCDKPSENRTKDFDAFCSAYKTLIAAKQMHILTAEAIEMYYPDQWRKSPEQVKGMPSREKTALAERVGSEITKQQFEQEMPIVFAALSAAWSHAY
jgi:putative ATP-dependent endonuclease of OLD family